MAVSQVVAEREIITLRGKSPEERAALKAKVMDELARELGPLDALRQALVAEGMMEPGIRGVRAVKTEAIDWDIRRDDPTHDQRMYDKPVTLSEDTLEEIAHERAEIQSRKIGEARATRDLLDRRPSSRSRAKLLAERGVSGAGGARRATVGLPRAGQRTGRHSGADGGQGGE